MAVSDTHRTKLLVTRMFSGVRERVFGAWTNSHDLHRWWHAGDTVATYVAEADVLVGAHYRLGMVSPVTGVEMSIGEFREILPPERLSMTWRRSGDPDHHEMMVSIRLVDHGKNTELLLSHDGFDSAEECETYSQSWNILLAELADFLRETESLPF